ncbi:MAG: hypothetical protein CVT94_05045 [Bacteroidetes bacterium HGW-Bacteroidetes-11]|nr:MAG: hypothetical protein CVT94_05045 [Bacteroidetes bacterium HGW-Bacteroidetes-11]
MIFLLHPKAKFEPKSKGVQISKKNNSKRNFLKICFFASFFVLFLFQNQVNFYGLPIFRFTFNSVIFQLFSV